jgi:hypothetical protein
VSKRDFKFRGDLVPERAGDLKTLILEEGNNFPEKKLFNKNENVQQTPLPTKKPKPIKNLKLIIDEQMT